MTRYYSATAQPTTLSAACTDTATTIQVTATTGFPAVEFILALDYGTAQQELVKVTAVAGTTLTVVRGFDSTTAQAHALGAAVRHVHSADDFRLSRTHEAASSGVHGASGALVGTTDTQALSNKDLTAGTNTFPTSLAKSADLTAHTGATAAHGTTGAIVGTTDAQTLTNKTVALGSNTVSGTTAQFNAANTDGDFATLAGAETLTNKTLASPTITGVGEARFFTKAADQSVTSTTTLTDDTDLQFSVVANATYLVFPQIYMTYDDSNSGGGYKVAWNFPTGATLNTVTYHLASDASWYLNNASGGGPMSNRLLGTSTEPIRFTIGATAGTVKFRFAQAASSTIATTVVNQSHIYVVRVA